MLWLITKITQKIESWASEVDLFYKIVESYYRNVVEKEVVLANITKDDNILFIGGGICPFSAILLHRKTGAKITVIDNDASCVNKARQVINRMELSGYVTVLFRDGRDVGLTLSAYTVVHFALQICPLECVFSYVEKHVIPGTKLLIRRPRKQLKKLYRDSFRHLPSILRFCPFTMHRQTRNIGSTLMYIKES